MRPGASRPKRASDPGVPPPRRRLLPAPWQRELALALLCGGLLAALVQARWELAQPPPAAAPTPVAPRPAEVPALAPVSAPRELPSPASAEAAVERGPWGALSTTQVWLSPPLHAVRAEDCAGALHPWRFLGLSQAQLQALVQQTMLPEADQRGLLATLRCEASGCTLTPTAAEREALPAAARAVLYQELARHKANPMQLYSVRFLPELVEPWLGAAALPERLRARVRRLMYPHGPHGAVMAFADQDTLCVGLSAQDRVTLVRALATAPAELLSLRVEPGEPVDERAAYWGQGGREDEVRPVLAALAQRPGGGSVDVAHLLPSYPAARLYHYPAAPAPSYSCHHGALNFFTDPPDPRYLSDAEVARALMERYQQVPGPPRLGDVLTLQRPDGSVLHSMAYVAADLVFTKNGLTHLAPWILARQRNIRALYADQTVTEHLYRRKP